MASNVPTIKQVAWISAVPQLMVAGLLIYVYYFFEFSDFILYGALTYLALSFTLRNLIAKNHRLGIKKLVKQQKFQEAIPLFEKSVDFFTKNNWVDKYRYLTILSSSKMTYKEMGLCNIAFCYSQIGNIQKAKEYYEQTLKEFPDNGIAIAALRMINSIQSSQETPA